MIYIYGNPSSKSLKLLCTKLEAFGIEVGGGLELDRAGRNPLIICWGRNLRGMSRILNPHGPKGNKWEELTLLRKAGVSIPRFILGGQTKPEGWYARRFHHHSANDLKRNLTRGDYYSEHVDCTKEYRVHVLQNWVRVALKVPKEGENAHPTFRTHSCGWTFRYGCYCDDVSPQIVLEAKRAVASVGYDFGAVDIGVKADHTPVVFEVNSAPTLSNPSAEWYARLFFHIYR